MSESRTIALGGLAFEVPPLPLRINRIVYPLCRKLTAAGLVERCAQAMGTLECSEEEFGDLVEIAFGAVTAADKDLTRAAFDELPIAPPELLDAFFLVRYQTGAWIERTAGEVEDAAAGEAPAGEIPPQ